MKEEGEKGWGVWITKATEQQENVGGEGPDRVKARNWVKYRPRERSWLYKNP